VHDDKNKTKKIRIISRGTFSVQVLVSATILPNSHTSVNIFIFNVAELFQDFPMDSIFFILLLSILMLTVS